MKNAIAGAERRITDVSKHAIHKARCEIWTPRESEARLNIVFVRLDAIVDAIRCFFRRRHVLISQTEIEREIRTHLPTVFAVEVRFANAVLEKERAVALLIVWRAAVDKLIEAVGVVDAVTRGDGAVVEASREVIGEIVKALAANVCPHSHLMGVEDGVEVVNKLVVSLKAVNREVARAAEARLCCDRSRIEETNDGRVVSGCDIYERGP